MLASIIIRTLNEEKHLDALLTSIKNQETGNLSYEVILVDSGSEDKTLQIAKSHGCKILHISRKEFSFGRSLNMGCETAMGDFLIMISGHCVPTNKKWLSLLCQPLVQNKASYSYGKQVGGSVSHFSECRIFAKYYPELSRIPQEGFFCNNANSALKRSVWDIYKFNEELTGLEDMELAQRLVNDGNSIAYVAEAVVYHHHEETWGQVKRRFEREAIALQKIMPQVHIHIQDLIRYVVSSVWLDWTKATKEKIFIRNASKIVQYRVLQFWGSFVGNHNHRKLSHTQKEEYFYPNELRSKDEAKNRRPLANESKQ